MRKVVVIEGKMYPYRNMILHGSLEPSDRPISVTYGGSWVVGAIVGRAVDFQRNEETGEISFEIEFDPRLPESEREFYEKTEATAFCSPVEFEDTETARNVTKGIIRSLDLHIPSAANPVVNLKEA